MTVFGLIQPHQNTKLQRSVTYIESNNFQQNPSGMGLVWINGPDFGIAQLEPPTVQDVLLPQPEEPWGTMGNHEECDTMGNTTGADPSKIPGDTLRIRSTPARLIPYVRRLDMWLAESPIPQFQHTSSH